MKKNFVKKLALGLALVMAVTSVPATSEAAAKPGFKSTKVTVKEGQTKKYNTKNASKYSVKFKIGNKAVATIKYSAGSKAVKVTGVAEGKTTLRADFKSYKTKKVTTVKIPVTVKAEKTEVKTFAATASRKITLTGTALNKLTAADVTVAGYTVVDFSATKTTATITLDRMMVPNTDISVTVGGFAGTVKYNLTVNSLAVVAGTFDDDRLGQTVGFSVNGEVIEVQDMLDNGYTVEFASKDAYNVDSTANIFENVTYGRLATPIEAFAGTHYVKVTVSDGTTVVTSEYTPIVITDLDASINSIDSYELTNTSTTPSISGVVMNSTTLVIGETAQFTEVLATVDGIKKQEITTEVGVKSSNANVLAWDAANKQLVAETAGTATITLSYGSATKTITFKVVTTPRALNSAMAVNAYGLKYTSDTVVSTSTPVADEETLDIIPLDQYGDPMANTDVFVASTNEDIAVVTDPVNWSTALTSDGTGVATATVDIMTNVSGRANIIVRNKEITNVTNQTNTKTLLTFAYRVVSDDTVKTQKLVVEARAIGESTDATLELYDDDCTTLVMKGYNAAGVFVENVNASANYTITSTDAAVVSFAQNSATTADAVITVASGSALNVKVYAHKAGKATITFKNDTSGDTVNLVMTVTDSRPALTGVTFKAASTVTTKNTLIDYRTFFNYTYTEAMMGTNVDPIISGISSNLSTTSKVRLDITGGTYALYLDRNDDGVLSTGVTGKPDDIELGYVSIDVVTGAYNLSAANNAATTDIGSYGYVKVVVTYPNGVVADTATVAVNVPAL